MDVICTSTLPLIILFLCILTSVIISVLYKSKERETFSDHDSIDIVYTWITSNDKAYQEYREQYKKEFQNTEAFGNVTELVSEISSGIQSIIRTKTSNNDCNRLSSVDEIIYSIYSVKHYMPWVNKIYVVLPESNIPYFPKEVIHDVELITQESILPKNKGPSFNSNTIECFLDKIPNLSDNFIYFNDDVFVTRPLERKHFIDSNDNVIIIPQLFLDKPISARLISSTILNDHTVGSRYNCYKYINKLLNEKGKDYIMISHAPLLIKKSILQKIKAELQTELNHQLNHTFRTKNDLVLLHFVYPHYCLGKGLATLSTKDQIKEIRWTDNSSINEITINALNNLNERYIYLLMNDERSECSKDTSDQMVHFLKRRFTK